MYRNGFWISNIQYIHTHDIIHIVKETGLDTMQVFEAMCELQISYCEIPDEKTVVRDEMRKVTGINKTIKALNKMGKNWGRPTSNSGLKTANDDDDSKNLWK